MTWTLSSNPIALMHGPTFLIFYYITVISIWFSFQKIIKKRVEKIILCSLLNPTLTLTY